MARQKFEHKNFSLPFGLLSPLLSTVDLHYASTKPPHQQKYLLNHKEQHSPSIKTTS